MQLFPEAALYWTRLIESAQIHGLPQNEYIQVYNLLAAFEMGDHHVANGKRRVLGNLSLADLYLNKVLASNGEVSLSRLGEIGQKNLIDSRRKLTMRNDSIAHYATCRFPKLYVCTIVILVLNDINEK